MALTLAKILLILLATFNLALISIFTMIGKNKIAIALSVLEAFLVTSTIYFD